MDIARSGGLTSPTRPYAVFRDDMTGPCLDGEAACCKSAWVDVGKKWVRPRAACLMEQVSAVQHIGAYIGVRADHCGGRKMVYLSKVR